MITFTFKPDIPISCNTLLPDNISTCSLYIWLNVGYKISLQMSNRFIVYMNTCSVHDHQTAIANKTIQEPPPTPFLFPQIIFNGKVKVRPDFVITWIGLNNISLSNFPSVNAYYIKGSCLDCGLRLSHFWPCKKIYILLYLFGVAVLLPTFLLRCKLLLIKISSIQIATFSPLLPPLPLPVAHS